MNDNAEFAIKRAMEDDPKLRVTMPNHTNDSLVESVYSLYNSK